MKIISKFTFNLTLGIDVRRICGRIIPCLTLHYSRSPGSLDSVEFVKPSSLLATIPNYETQSLARKGN